MGLFQITILTTHLNNEISVSANEIACTCNWILKKIYNTLVENSDKILAGSCHRILACS